MTDLSVLIPARCEEFLAKTIDSVLENSEADTEIIVVCDGSWPAEPIPDNPRVVLLHHTEARGQRQSINEAARIARGRFLMKLDAHCAVGPGFDRILIEDWQPGWTLVPLMINLDHETWQPKMHKQTRAMYIGMSEGRELRPEYYGSRQPKFDSPVHETMACMGPGWFLSKEDFWKQGGCDEAHGSWGQQSVEVSLKAWLSGGALMTDERTWFAHWFRGGGGPGFPYPISGREVEAARTYSRNLWLNNQWPGQVRTLEWLVKRFDPPGWDGYAFPPTELRTVAVDEAAQKQAQGFLYQYVHRHGKDVHWRGVHIIKMASDLLLYQQCIWENKPDVVAEIGTAFGGSSLFFQDCLDLVGNGGKVITIDIQERVRAKDPRITYLVGDSTSPEMVAEVKRLTEGKSVMFSIDGDHSRVKVKWELYRYSPLVTPGQFLVVEDCYVKDMQPFGPKQAVDWFLAHKRGKGFYNTHLDREQLVGVCIGGWLRRKP